MKWISHRGESNDAPENTMSAFRLAWQRSTDGIELDVRMTKDGHLVCCHDIDTDIINGPTLVVAESTLAELRELDFGSWKASKFAGEKIPLLSEVLAEAPEDKIILLELKAGPKTFSELKRVIINSPLGPKQLIPFSSDDAAIAEIKHLMPDFKAYLTTTHDFNGRGTISSGTFDELICRTSSINADGVYMYCSDRIDAELVKNLHQANLEVHTWTIDDLKKAKRFIKLGFDSITSNYAYFLRQSIKF